MAAGVTYLAHLVPFPSPLTAFFPFLVTFRSSVSSSTSVLLSPPQIPAGLKGFLGIPEDSWGFLRIPEDSSGLHYNLCDFELEENNSVKSSGILRTGTEFGRISAKLEYSTSLLAEVM